jgi:hypothetical protein
VRTEVHECVFERVKALLHSVEQQTVDLWIRMEHVRDLRCEVLLHIRRGYRGEVHHPQSRQFAIGHARHICDALRLVEAVAQLR